MLLSRLLDTLPVTDPEEDAFLVFSQDIPSQSLGFIDSQAPAIELTVAGCDLLIHHSRGLLTSDRTGGTTGAVVWKVTPLFAEWIASPTNFLFANACLSSSSTVLELGAGISGIVALTLGARVARYTATDQAYVLKILKQNIAENLDAVLPKKLKANKKRTQNAPANDPDSRIRTQTLDWETDDVSNMDDVDFIVSCDCIYNESLIEPLNTTCAAICRLRQQDQEDAKPTICLIAQQLRAADVFETWLKSFHRLFNVWQVPDRLLSPGLREGSGFVVHVGIVR